MYSNVNCQINKFVHMNVIQSSLSGVLIIEPEKYSDERGFFSETYSRKVFSNFDLNFNFVQDNHVCSWAKGTLRGLHFQKGPRAQDKLVRVSRGRILDIAVDIRPNSPNFKNWISVILSEKNWRQLLIPAGFAHGYRTLEPNTEVIYKVTRPYEPDSECGIIWSDPDLAINWMIDREQPIVSEKDRSLPLLADCLQFLEK